MVCISDRLVFVFYILLENWVMGGKSLCFVLLLVKSSGCGDIWNRFMFVF